MKLYINVYDNPEMITMNFESDKIHTGVRLHLVKNQNGVKKYEILDDQLLRDLLYLLAKHPNPK